RGVDDGVGLPVDGGLGVVAPGVGQALRFGAVHVRAVDVEARVDGPDVALRAVGPRRAGVAMGVGGGVDDALAVSQEVAAGGDALAGGDHADVRAVGVHHEELVALEVVAGGLEDQFGAVGGPVGLGVLAAVG